MVVALLATSASGAFAQSNKEIVLDGMTGLFVRKDPTVIAKYWDPGYIQHNPRVPNGTDVLKGGKIVEHWDFLQEEVPADKTASGNPMFTNPQK